VKNVEMDVENIF